MMRKFNIIFCALFLLTVFQANAQLPDSSAWLNTFPDQFHIKPVVQYQPMTLRLQEDGADQQLIFSPNVGPRYGVAANIADIHLAASFKMPGSFTRDQEEYGETEYHDFRINANGRRLVLNFDYQYRKGYYLSGIRELPELPDNEKPLLPALSTESYELNGTYVFNPDKFSYRLVITQMDKQKKSAGSFLLLSSAKYFTISGERNFVPDDFSQEFNDPIFLDYGEISGFALMPGYSHTFVAGDFYLNVGAALGPDLQYQETRIKAESATEYDWDLSYKASFRGGLGYDTGQFFTGVYYLKRQSRYSIGDLDVIHSPGFVRFVVGHRFQEPDWMQDIRELKVYRWARNLF